TLLSCRRFFLCVRRVAALGRRTAHGADVIMSVIVDLKLRANERPLPPEIPSPPTMVAVRPVSDDALDEQRPRTDAGLILNVRHRLVVRGQSHRSGHRLAGRIGYGHFDGAVFAGPMYLLGGCHAHVEEIAHRRYEHLTRLDERLPRADDCGFD